jgi:hypothetical protein
VWSRSRRTRGEEEKQESSKKMETRMGRGGLQTRQSFAGLVAIVAVVCSVLLLGAVEVQAGIFDYNDGLNSNSRILERVAMWSVKDSPIGSNEPYAKFERTPHPNDYQLVPPHQLIHSLFIRTDQPFEFIFY